MESMSQVPFYVNRGDTGYGGFQVVVCIGYMRELVKSVLGWYRERRFD